MRNFLIVAALLLQACAQPPSHLDDYLGRLENVLDRKAIEAVDEAISGFPKARQLQLQSTSAELSIREFLSLRECRLHSTIAHRNSQLGKVATASQKLFSDLAILHLGPQCVERLGKVELASKLQRFLTQKEQNLHSLLWSALLGQTEHASFWHDRRNNKHYPLELSIDVSSDIIGLEKFVARVINGERFFSSQVTDRVERHLGRLRAGDGGRLLGEYRRLAAGLNKANSVVQQRLDAPLCLSSGPTQKAGYLANVVNTRFIEYVQRHSVRLDQRAEKLLDVFYRLERPLLNHATNHYKAWAQQRDATIREGQSATLNHVLLLQNLYKQCGLIAGD
ncbi:MAG: hypothetical protein ACJAQ6_000014 [Arenicella sp.]|jgi:hypothetical protein